MSVFQVDAAGALVRENGAFVRTEGLDEIRQGHQVGLLMLRREVPWDLSRGLPWFDDPATGAPGLLSKATPREALAARIRARLASRKGTVDITEFELVDAPEIPSGVAARYVARVSGGKLVQDLLALQS